MEGGWKVKSDITSLYYIVILHRLTLYYIITHYFTLYHIILHSSAGAPMRLRYSASPRHAQGWEPTRSQRWLTAGCAG